MILNFPNVFPTLKADRLIVATNIGRQIRDA